MHQTLKDISKDPFYLKLCLMNARVHVFNKNFKWNLEKLQMNKFGQKVTSNTSKSVESRRDRFKKKILGFGTMKR